MVQSMETLAQHENIQLEKALFDFTGKIMNKASQVPQKSNEVDHFYYNRRSMKRS